MSDAAKSLLSELGPLVSHVLIQMPNQFVAFGAPAFDDLVIRGALERSVKSSRLFTPEGATEDSQNRCDQLWSMVSDLTDKGMLGFFNLTHQQTESIRRCIKKMDATHVRFHSERNGIHVSIFDFRRFEFASRLHREKEVRLVVDTISKQDAFAFTATVMATTLMKLPLDSYSVGVGRNGIVKMSASTKNLNYLIRDQEVTEPASFSASDRLASEIVLWLQTRTSEQEIRTIQQQDPESESEQKFAAPSHV